MIKIQKEIKNKRNIISTYIISFIKKKKKQITYF